MKKFFLLSLVAVAVLLSTGFALVGFQQKANASNSVRNGSSKSKVPFTAEDMVGEWQSVGCDSISAIGEWNTGNGFFQRFYVITPTNAVVRYSFFTDSACQKPLYSMRIFAWSELGKVRTDLPHTREALIVFDTTLLTADSAQGLQLLNSCVPSMTVGQEYDVTSTGCAAIGVHSRNECIGDYELVRLENGYLTYGYRTANMCTAAGRPSRTQTAWVKKVSPQDFKG